MERSIVEWEAKIALIVHFSTIIPEGDAADDDEYRNWTDRLWNVTEEKDETHPSEMNNIEFEMKSLESSSCSRMHKQSEMPN